MKRSLPWTPQFQYQSNIVRALMRLEMVRSKVDALSLPLAITSALRQQARLRSTHFSTRIEGNRLTLKEAGEVVGGRKRRFHGRERDVKEVENYWHALLRVESLADKNAPLTEKLVRQIHGWVMGGPRSQPTPYRSGQNAVREAGTNRLVYLPPEAKDVPTLMASMTMWARKAIREGIPTPIVAGLLHYQFVTIHPYDDGNGRTARLIATFLLHSGGYGLNGFYSMEEHHARDLEGYYRSLVTHPHHNYYEGRSDADLTPWVTYFIKTLGKVFEETLQEARRLSETGQKHRQSEPSGLDHRARHVWAYLADKGQVGTNELSRSLGISERMMRVLLERWIKDGWVAPTSKARKGRTYQLNKTKSRNI
jgi:Fic family protein